jgi:hypothetical protein
MSSLLYMALGKVMVTTLQENQPDFPSVVLVDPQWVEGSWFSHNSVRIWFSYNSVRIWVSFVTCLGVCG